VFSDGIFKLLRRPGIDSKESFPPACACARICKLFKEPRNQLPAWRTGTQPYLTYRLGYTGWRNRFLGSLSVYKYGLWLQSTLPNAHALLVIDTCPCATFETNTCKLQDFAFLFKRL